MREMLVFISLRPQGAHFAYLAPPRVHVRRSRAPETPGRAAVPFRAGNIAY